MFYNCTTSLGSRDKEIHCIFVEVGNSTFVLPLMQMASPLVTISPTKQPVSGLQSSNGRKTKISSAALLKPSSRGGSDSLTLNLIRL